MNINKYRREGKSRKEIFQALKAHYGFQILTPDQIPLEAINTHREAASVRETKQKASEWKIEH